MEERLLDLDELVLRCKSDQARTYIAEAVACYRAGAFRACIVVTWVAVVFDIIYKLDELTLAGDKNAEKRRIDFDDFRKKADITNSLKFERQVLAMAKDEFELISPLEYEDLQRLLADRNRCAHPSMNGHDEIYRPTAELARYHLRNTVTHLLQHQPVQGKAALDRLEREVNSVYFPTVSDDALQYFQHGPLARPREALVRNFVVILLKALLRQNLDDPTRKRQAAALNAVRRMHPNTTEITLHKKLSDTIRTTSDDLFENVIAFLTLVPDTLQFFTSDLRHKVETYIDKLDIKTSPSIFMWFLDYPPLRDRAEQRIERLNEDDISSLVNISARKEVKAQALKLYGNSESFRQANDLGKQIIQPLIRFFEVEDIDKLIAIVASNEQVAGSFELVNIVNGIIKNDQIPREKLDDLIVQVGVSDSSKLNNMKKLLTVALLEQIIAKSNNLWFFPELLEDLLHQERISKEEYTTLQSHYVRKTEAED